MYYCVVIIIKERTQRDAVIKVKSKPIDRILITLGALTSTIFCLVYHFVSKSVYSYELFKRTKALSRHIQGHGIWKIEASYQMIKNVKPGCKFRETLVS